jgi:hypothetical protein
MAKINWSGKRKFSARGMDFTKLSVKWAKWTDYPEIEIELFATKEWQKRYEAEGDREDKELRKALRAIRQDIVRATKRVARFEYEDGWQADAGIKAAVCVLVSLHAGATEREVLDAVTALFNVTQ